VVFRHNKTQFEVVFRHNKTQFEVVFRHNKTQFEVVFRHNNHPLHTFHIVLSKNIKLEISRTTMQLFFPLV